MTFEYRCEKCGIIEKDFPIGKADGEVPCDCGATAKRHYGSMSFVLKGGGWPGKSISMNREMTSRNEAAGRRMRKEHTPGMKPVAYDYGGGDVREAKEVKTE